MYPAGVSGIRTQYLTLPEGASVRVIESGPSDGDAVMLVHGWGGSVYSFSDNIQVLAAAGYRAIAFDLPGHGLSDKPTDEKRYSTWALTDTVLAVANGLRLRTFAYVGHSMGGLVGLGLALREEQRIDRLVLINAAGLGYASAILPLRLVSPRIINHLTPPLLTRGVIRRILHFAFGTDERPTERDIDEYWAPTQFPEFAAACRACIHQVDWRPFPEAALRGLKLPVLVISGERDRVVRCEAKRGELMPAGRVVVIRDGGHLVMQECAGTTNAELLQFLASSSYRR